MVAGGSSLVRTATLAAFMHSNPRGPGTLPLPKHSDSYKVLQMLHEVRGGRAKVAKPGAPRAPPRGLPASRGPIQGSQSGADPPRTAPASGGKEPNASLVVLGVTARSVPGGTASSAAAQPVDVNVGAPHTSASAAAMVVQQPRQRADAASAAREPSTAPTIQVVTAPPAARPAAVPRPPTARLAAPPLVAPPHVAPSAAPVPASAPPAAAAAGPTPAASTAAVRAPSMTTSAAPAPLPVASPASVRVRMRDQLGPPRAPLLVSRVPQPVPATTAAPTHDAPSAAPVSNGGNQAWVPPAPRGLQPPVVRMQRAPAGTQKEAAGFPVVGQSQGVHHVLQRVVCLLTCLLACLLSSSRHYGAELPYVNSHRRRDAVGACSCTMP